MNNYNKIKEYTGRITKKSQRFIYIKDEDNRVGFDEENGVVTIYAQFYINHDANDILKWLDEKTELNSETKEVKQEEKDETETVDELTPDKMNKNQLTELLINQGKTEEELKGLSKQNLLELVK